MMLLEREREKKVQIAQFERKQVFFPLILFEVEMGFNKKRAAGWEGMCPSFLLKGTRLDEQAQH